MHNNLVKEACKKKNVKLKDLAKALNLKPTSFSISLKNLDLKKLYKIAVILEVNIQELLPPPKGFSHLYDEHNKWYGIHKK